MTRIAFDIRYDAPPDYVAAYLTDFRPDDSQRFFDNDRGHKVERISPRQVRLETTWPIGVSKSTVTIESPTRWSAQGGMWKGDRQVARSSMVETVKPEGKGTLHNVTIDFEPLTLGMKIMMALGGYSMMKKDLLKGFEKVREDMETQLKAGKGPTS